MFTAEVVTAATLGGLVGWLSKDLLVPFGMAASLLGPILVGFATGLLVGYLWPWPLFEIWWEPPTLIEGPYSVTDPARPRHDIGVK